MKADLQCGKAGMPFHETAFHAWNFAGNRARTRKNRLRGIAIRFIYGVYRGDVSSDTDAYPGTLRSDGLRPKNAVYARQNAE